MTPPDDDSFERSEPDWRRPPEPGSSVLVLSLDGFEGPIDVLLSLSREQKVDLTRISILELADQYLEFIRAARRLDLDLAADYLVMAAWLAYLKSRLLLPQDDPDDEPMSPEDLAEALRFQLRRLEAMREAGAQLMARPRLGIDVFARGMSEPIGDLLHPVYEDSLFDLLSAYGAQQTRMTHSWLYIPPLELYAVDEAVARIRKLLGRMPNWRTLASFLPDDLRDGLLTRSAYASTLAASLELAKEGQIELLQNETFGPLYLRARSRER